MKKIILSVFVALTAVANVNAMVDPNPPVDVPDSSVTIALLSLGVVCAFAAKRFGRRS